MPKQRRIHSEAFLNRIQKYIGDSRISQSEIGRALGYERGQFSRRVNGLTAWSPDDIVQFCATLKLLPADQVKLLQLAGYPTPTLEPVSQHQQQERAQRLRAMFHDNSGFINARLASFVGRLEE